VVYNYEPHLSFGQLQIFSLIFALTEDEDRSTGCIGVPPPCLVHPYHFYAYTWSRSAHPYIRILGGRREVSLHPVYGLNTDDTNI